MRQRVILFVLFVCLFASVQAQKSNLISGRFEKTKVETFFQQIENQTPYFFYYDTKELDSITVTLSVANQPLNEVLKQAFQNTDVQFSVDDQNRVFITRKIQVITSLPSDFFEKKTNDSRLYENLASNLERKTNGSPKRITENKIYEIGVRSKDGPHSATITGYVRNEKSGEPIINASVFVDSLNRGSLTDQYGYFTLTVPQGKYNISVQGIGMKDVTYRVVINNSGTLNIELKEQVGLLKEVVVSAQKVTNVNRVQLGVEHLTIEAIKQMPTAFGEADILRAVLTLPGVKSVGEASTGFNVRGGSADQNLILMNGATIYNPSHFFGMFSAFNPEIVKDVELYKASVPAKFGGRLSSVLDVGLREGNKKTISGSAGIGLVTSRFNIEGPIVKDKTSFILGGRSTYANWLLNLLPNPYERSKASFNDGNISISHRINAKNDLYFTGYFSNDKFNLASDTTYGYGNRNVNLRWKHNFSGKLLAQFSAGYDSYNYNVNSEKNKINAYTLKFDVNQFVFKSDFSCVLNTKHSVDFGLNTIRYILHPGSFHPAGNESLVKPDVVPEEKAMESALYLTDRFTVSPKFNLSAGIRYSIYNYLGAQSINYYADGLPKEEGNITATKTYSSGQIIKTYQAPEFRLSARYAFSSSFSIKAGFNTLQQYIHMLSNTTAIAPTDIWKLSDPNIRPQQGSQISLGLYKNLKSNTIETSAEVYYKNITDYLDYKPGATLVLNHHIETDVINTKGKAYGAELMIKKTAGKLNGWVSYTYSRILLKIDDPTISTPINGGKWYPANYDKPNDATAVGNFKVNHRFSLSLNLTYSTGRPITLPVGRFFYAGSQRVLYSDRNSYRIPDYFRSDFSLNIDGNYKVSQRTHNSWTIGVYNLTGRRNPYSVFYVSENGRINGYKLSVFGSAIPFVNFNIRF